MSATAGVEAPVSDMDIFCMAAILNPQEYDMVLREMAPVVYLNKYNMWVTGRHEHAETILSDHDRFSAFLRPFFEPASIRADILITDDPPKHTRVRAVIQKALSPAVMRRMREMFEREAELLVDGLLADGSVDLEARDELVGRYVLKVFPDILGLREDGREHLLSYGDVVFNTFGPENELYHDALSKAGPVLEWVGEACKPEFIKADGIAGQMYAAAEAGIVTEREAELLVLSLLSAGTDSTIVSFLNTLHAFTQFPGQWRALRDDPALTRGVLDESIRYESITRFLGRGLLCDVEIEGVVIPKDAKVGCMMFAVGRDPRRWDKADEFDIRRKTVGHLSFGTGIHACVGQAVARMEAECLLGALARRVERIELIGETRPVINNIAHGYAHLPLRLHAA